MTNITPTEIAIEVIKITQPIGSFYVGKVSASDLRRIAFSDIRRIQERDFETYTGIQRPLSETRVREIKEYISSVDATFPNSIIVTISSDRVRLDDGKLWVKDMEDSAKLIDGQHRLAGFTSENSHEFDLIVSIFIDLDIEDQAAIFSVINLKQTKVNPSLVYDLFELEKTRSPQKTAHDVAKSLNSEENSPFFRRVKILGVVPRTADGEALYRPPLTQATFVREIIGLISSSPESDRNLLKKGSPIPHLPNAIEEGLIFRPFFEKDEDWAILKAITNYFSAVKKAFPTQWEAGESPLSRTIGYRALMRLLKDLFVIGYKKNDVSFDYFHRLFSSAANRATQQRVNFDFARFPASGTGEADLYKCLLELTRE